MASTFSYLLGNLLGRAIVSYVLVWLVLFLLSRFNWRLALVRSRRWPAVLAVALLVLLGMTTRFAQAALG